MILELFVNNGVGVLASDITTTPAAGTVETWTLAPVGTTLPLPLSGVSTALPTAVSGVSRYRAAIGTPADLNPEIIWVTNTSGTTLTVMRGKEGSPVKTHLAATSVLTQVVTAGTVLSQVLDGGSP